MGSIRCSRIAHLWVAFPLTVACSARPSTGGAVAENGQAGSRGATQCEVDTDCDDEHAWGSTGPIGHLTLLESGCAQLRDEPPHCECRVGLTVTPRADAGIDAIVSGPMVLHPGNRSGGCSVPSRSPGCLYCASEFPGCDLARPDSCDAICRDAVARVESELQRVIVVSRRLSYCDPDMKTCQFVTQFDDKCYVGPPNAPDPPEVSCAASNEELIERLDAPPASYCAAP